MSAGGCTVDVVPDSVVIVAVSLVCLLLKEWAKKNDGGAGNYKFLPRRRYRMYYWWAWCWLVTVMIHAM
jgi:hypothetical protein